MAAVDWVWSKHALPAHEPGVECVLSRDIAPRAGAKQFALFASGAAAFDYAERHRGGALYEVLEVAERPCRMYFDIDRPDTVYTDDVVASTVLGVLRSYLSDTCDVDLDVTPGAGVVQVASATTGVKTSLHIVVDILVADVDTHKRFTTAFVAHILADAESYPCLIGAGGVCVIDLAVYTRFRSYRMLGMIKSGRANALRPIRGSSDRIADHSINVLSDQPVPSLTLPAAVSNWSGSSKPQSLKPRAPAVNTPVTPDELLAVQEILNGWSSVRVVWPDGIVVVAGTSSAYGERLRLHCAKCPYKGRCHKNNHVYLSVAPHRASARIICHDKECRDTIIDTGYKMLYADIERDTVRTDAVNADATYHQQAKNIAWAQDYDAPSMRPYPDRPIVCVCAGMGVGKSVEMVAFVKRLPRKEKLLLLTFSRALALKAYREFGGLGFVNYQDSYGEIRDDRVIVCTDSLHRVVTSNFDVVIVDEVLSVILHFNSPLMERRAENSQLFELQLRQARRILVLDAAADSSTVKQVVDYFADAKLATPYWIRNTYIRPSNRKCELILCNEGGVVATRQTAIICVALKVAALLDAGKRVFVPSATKRLTDGLERFVKETRPHIRIRKHNSSTGAAELADVNTTWSECDLLITSPSVSAGVSYEGILVDGKREPHFHALVAHFVNSPFTPSADICLQMAFRVRGLIDGDMTLVISNEQPSLDVPDTLEMLEARLDADVALVGKRFIATELSFFAQKKIDGSRLEYDKDRLSWRIILGIVQMSNRSGMQFTDLITNTLIEDYNIPLIARGAPPEARPDDPDLSILQAVMKVRSTPEFADITILDHEAYEVLRRDTAGATDAQRAAMRLYQFQYDVWGAERVDKDFYDKIMMSTANEEYNKFKRLCLATGRTVAENRAVMTREMNAVLSYDDPNLELFKTKRREFYIKLLDAQALLVRVTTGEQRAALGGHGCADVLTATIRERVEEWRADLGAARGASDRMYGITAAVLANGPLSVFARVVKEAFGLRAVPKTTNTTSKEFGKALKITASKAVTFYDAYNPATPNMRY
jgi:hypothetical protein